MSKITITIDGNEVSQAPGGAKLVADIAARDAIVVGERSEGMLVFVTDASADGTVASGTATYALKAGLTNSDWEKISEGESIDLTATSLGLGNVDNTSDVNKPISSATQTALNLKANIANPTFTGTVSGVTNTHVGLGNVDNTSDVNKPISSATQTALDAKSDELTVETKSSAYTLVNGDVDKQIRVTGTTTITLPESLTWPTNNGCEIVNVGSDTVTVATSGTVTVNGSTDDLTLLAYESVVLMPISSNVYLGTGV